MNKLVPKPGVVVETRDYSDEEVAAWDKADKLADRERTRILQRLGGKASPERDPERP